MYERISAHNAHPAVVARVEALREAGYLACDAVGHNDEAGCPNPDCWDSSRGTEMRFEFLKKKAVIVGRKAADLIFEQYRAKGQAGSGDVAEVSKVDLAAAIAIGALNAWQTPPEDVS